MCPGRAMMVVSLPKPATSHSAPTLLHLFHMLCFFHLFNFGFPLSTSPRSRRRQCSCCNDVVTDRSTRVKNLLAREILMGWEGWRGSTAGRREPDRAEWSNDSELWWAVGLKHGGGVSVRCIYRTDLTTICKCTSWATIDDHVIKLTYFGNENRDLLWLCFTTSDFPPMKIFWEKFSSHLEAE